MDLDEPLVISYCNSPKDDMHQNTKNYVRTLENNHWKYMIVGSGDVWKGWSTRMTKYVEVLSALDPNKIVIITDARDVFCTRQPTNFIKNFKKYNKKIVVSMELFAEGYMEYDPNKTYFQVTWIENYWKMYNIDHDKTSRKFVNNGLVAGYAGELIKFYAWSIANGFTDDQKALGAYVNEFPELIHADIHAELLHTCVAFISGGLSNSEIQSADSPSLMDLVGRKSFFLHMPGLEISPGQKMFYHGANIALLALNQQTLLNCYPHYRDLIL